MAWALVTPSSRGIGHALTRHLLQTTPAWMPIVATARRDVEGVRESLLADLRLSEGADAVARRLDVQRCDLEDEESVRGLAGYCRERYNSNSTDSGGDGQGRKEDMPSSPHLRLAFCVPGLLGPRPERAPSQIDVETTLATLRLNLVAPMLVAKYFLDFLPSKSLVRRMGHQQQQHQKASSSSSPTWTLPPIPSLLPSNMTTNPNTGSPARQALALFAFMSARVGSISDNTAQGGWYAYRSSKAGLNQLVRSLDIHARRVSGGNAVCVGLHPGTVRTELSRAFWEVGGGSQEGSGNGNANSNANANGKVRRAGMMEPEEAAERLGEVVRRLMVRNADADGDGDGRGVGGRCWDWKGEEIFP